MPGVKGTKYHIGLSRQDFKALQNVPVARRLIFELVLNYVQERGFTTNYIPAMAGMAAGMAAGADAPEDIAASI